MPADGPGASQRTSAPILITLVSELTVARTVQAAVRILPGVHDLSSGVFAEAATYGPGEIVRGVVVRRLGGGLVVAVHLVVAYGDRLVLPDLANEVRRVAGQAIALLGAAPVQRIDVAIDDLWIEGASRR